MSKTRPWRRLYGLKRWKDLRRWRLSVEPFCRFCLDRGVYTKATVCDHIKPHKGDEDLFFDPENTQSLCKPCHDRDKQALERGFTPKPRIGDDGWPIE